MRTNEGVSILKKAHCQTRSATMKRLLYIIMVLCLAFSTGCSKEPSITQSAISHSAVSQKEESPVSLGTTVGYVPSQVEWPDWLNELWGWDTYGDTIWIGSAIAEKEYVVAAYNTLDEHWEKYAIDTADARNPVPESFSVSGNSIWILFRESYTHEDIINGAQPSDLKYYISYYNIEQAYSQCREIPFAGSENSESNDTDFCSIQALDSSSAL